MSRDRGIFFGKLRGTSLFPHGLRQQQVDGLGRLLDVWDSFYQKDGERDELAYDLATSFHETGEALQPVAERGSRGYFAKYEPGTALGRMLGNTEPGDGWRFRGMGDVQNTGRRNAQLSGMKLTAKLGKTVDFVARPEDRLDPVLSAHCLFLGDREGWWSGKALARYLDGKDEPDEEQLREFIAARHVVNGTDKARMIAGYALFFEKALRAADGEE